MVGDARVRMVRGAAALLARKGLQATSLSEVLNATGAPRGSIYHHFPEGKDQLVGAAVDLVTARMLEALDQRAGDGAEEVTAHLLNIWRVVLTRSDFGAGCALLAVTVATDSSELLEQASAAFCAWRARLAELFEQGGLTAQDAPRFAMMVIASTEGAVVLSRAERSMEPFEMVADQLIELVAALARR